MNAIEFLVAFLLIELVVGSALGFEKHREHAIREHWEIGKTVYIVV